MSGKYKSNMIPLLIISGKHITNQYQITKELAKFFAEVSSTNHYSSKFIEHKNNLESQPFIIPFDEIESYNCKFTMSELEESLAGCLGS